LLSSYQTVTINKFCFKGLKKTFCYCVIPAVSCSTHASYYFVRLQGICKSIIRILYSLVRVKNKSFLNFTVFHSHSPSWYCCLLCCYALTQTPTYVLSIIHV